MLNPRMLPSFGGKVRRKVNKKMLVSQIKPVLEAHNGPVVAITTVPYVCDLIGSLPVDRWVYYCVDDWSAWPEMDSSTLLNLEAELIDKSDEIICVSHALQNRIESNFNRQTVLLQHGFDEQFLRRPKTRKLLKNYPGRKILYWGLIDARIDEAIISAVSKAFPQDSVVFVGPLANPNEKLFLPPNVYSHGVVNFNQLPTLAAESSALIMPYTDTPVTRQIQPLKMLEYLAVDKPVVARNLPATQEWEDCLNLADSPEEFVEQLQLVLSKGVSYKQRRARKKIENLSWKTKTEQFELMFLG